MKESEKQPKLGFSNESALLKQLAYIIACQHYCLTRQMQ